MDLTQHLAGIRQQNRKVLSLFVTAGYPSIQTTVPLVHALAEAGADIVELGIPFSDPIADGPVIQMSSETALRNGITLVNVLEIASQILAKQNIPIVLMGYANPVHHYGMEKFFAQCRDIGIAGTIIPDISLEESDGYRKLARQNKVSSILLAAPTTSNERLAQLDAASSGFLYCVSITGVTGARGSIAAEAESFLARARSVVRKNPLLAGFGISTPESTRRVASHCDGVIVGSALLTILNEQSSDHSFEKAIAFTRSLRNALDNLSID